MWAPGWLVCMGKAHSHPVFGTLLELASPGRGGLSPVKCQSIKNLENKKRGFRGGQELSLCSGACELPLLSPGT